MRLRTIIGIGLAILLAATARGTTTFKARNQQPAQQFEKRIPIITRQLKASRGVIPVELKCGSAELSAPNALQDSPCVIVNNTDKPITAVNVAISIILEKDGKISTDTSFLVTEMFLHPDFKEEHKNNHIRPGGEDHISDLPTTYDDEVVIKGVKVQVDYVEFEDGTTLGSNKAGSRIIGEMRAGAAKYKNWLIRQYNLYGKSINSIVTLLENPSIPEEELGIASGNEQQGAAQYRNDLRRAYKAKGEEVLSKYLERTGAPINKQEVKRCHA